MRAKTAPDEARFDGVVRPMIPDLFAYLVRRLDSVEDAADALSETLLVLWRRRALFLAQVEPRRYAYGVARRSASQARRAQNRRRALAARLAQEPTVAAEPSPSTQDEQLAAALLKLPNRDRELVLLVAWEGLGVAEAGAVLGLRPEASRARYSRARARLRESLSASSSPSDIVVLGTR